MQDGAFRVLIAGNDVTSRFSPLLEELSVSRSAGRSTDSLTVTLADPEGQTFLPPTRAPVEVHLGRSTADVGWAFTGYVTEVSSKGDKEGGRKLIISASSADHHSEIKTPATRSLDDLPFSDVAREWGSKVGLNVEVIGSAAEIARDYWLQQNESYMAWGQRMARELGLTFKVIGDRAFFSPRNEGISVSGRALPTIRARWGHNLISWDMTPIAARPQYAEAHTVHYDLEKAEWIDVARRIANTTVPAAFRTAFPFAKEGSAKQGAESSGRASEREKGGGTLTILGDHSAEPEALCELEGTRPGIDGTYTIDGLEHALSKENGFTTSLTLKRPDGAAGVDQR